MVALAERQHGVLAHGQLVELGLSSSAIGRRAERGHLHRLHRGVYALGHRALREEAHLMAAVFAGGPGAVLSHRSAAHLWAIRRSVAGRAEITTRAGRRAGPGVEVHHGRLAADELTTLDGIPATTASRTLLDLAAVLPRHQLERALREAEYRRLWDATSLADLLERYPRKRGTATLRRLLRDGRADDGITRSELEERFIPLLDAAGLPRPKLNTHVRAAERLFEADCVWERERVIVELDSRSAHGRPSAFEQDRARDRALAVAGWRTIRVTSRQLQHERESVAGDLRLLLGAG